MPLPFSWDIDFSNEATEQLVCRYTGEAMSMGFNSRIFVELLNNIDTEETIMQMSTPSRQPSFCLQSKNLMSTSWCWLCLFFPAINGAWRQTHRPCFWIVQSGPYRHMIIANYMVTRAGLDEVWMVVSPHNPLKDKKVWPMITTDCIW